MPELFTIERLTAGYGEAVVLNEVSLALAEGAVARAARPQRHGQDHADQFDRGRDPLSSAAASALDGRDITRLRPDQRAHAGIGWVPQERNIFKSLTVEENLTAVAQPGAVDGGAHLRAVSAPGRAAPQPRQPALRRRAADARGRARAWCSIRASSCSTSRWKGWPRSWSRSCWRRCGASSATRACRRSWSSRTRRRCSASPTGRRSSSAAASSTRAHSADLAADRGVLESYLGVTAAGPRRGAKARH